MILENPLTYFFDPILRAPTIGSIFMCLAAGLVGSIVFLKKQSLLGEALSHAAYPGVILGVICAGLLGLDAGDATSISILIMVGAFLTALMGTWIIHLMVTRLKVRADSALCFVLSSFFGIGLTLASQVQFSYSALYQQIQVYLYGQAATMTDIHIAIYAGLSLVIILMVIFLYKEIELMVFDAKFAQSLGFNVKAIQTLFLMLAVLAIVIGIRSVGVVLMSAMLIAPPAAARQFTNKLYVMLIIAASIGMVSGFFGNYLSVEISQYYTGLYPGMKLSLPTGPMIVLVASVICVFALLFAPERGVVLRGIRIAKFRYICMCENILKAMWRISPTNDISFERLAKLQTASKLYLLFVLNRLCSNGWVEKRKDDSYRLTHEGQLWAAKIVRLHRLWEVYLADYLGVGVERVHRSAEEMEHILTPELDRELTLLLDDPKIDPHDQPIPPNTEF